MTFSPFLHPYFVCFLQVHFVYLFIGFFGTLLCTSWKKTADSEEIREWWEIESIKDGKMKWTALRMRDDQSTYTATFEMTRVK